MEGSPWKKQERREVLVCPGLALAHLNQKVGDPICNSHLGLGPKIQFFRSLDSCQSAWRASSTENPPPALPLLKDPAQMWIFEILGRIPPPFFFCVFPKVFFLIS